MVALAAVQDVCGGTVSVLPVLLGNVLYAH